MPPGFPSSERNGPSRDSNQRKSSQEGCRNCPITDRDKERCRPSKKEEKLQKNAMVKILVDSLRMSVSDQKGWSRDKEKPEADSVKRRTKMILSAKEPEGELENDHTTEVLNPPSSKETCMKGESEENLVPSVINQDNQLQDIWERWDPEHQKEFCTLVKDKLALSAYTSGKSEAEKIVRDLLKFCGNATNMTRLKSVTDSHGSWEERKHSEKKKKRSQLEDKNLVVSKRNASENHHKEKDNMEIDEDENTFPETAAKLLSFEKTREGSSEEKHQFDTRGKQESEEESEDGPTLDEVEAAKEQEFHVEDEADAEDLQSHVQDEADAKELQSPVEDEADAKDLQSHVQDEADAKELQSHVEDEADAKDLQSHVEDEADAKELQSPVEDEADAKDLQSHVQDEADAKDLQSHVQDEADAKELQSHVEDEADAKDLQSYVEDEADAKDLQSHVQDEAGAEDLQSHVQDEADAKELQSPVEDEADAKDLQSPVEDEADAKELQSPVEDEADAKELQSPVEDEADAKDLQSNVEDEADAEDLQSNVDEDEDGEAPVVDDDDDDPNAPEVDLKENLEYDRSVEHEESVCSTAAFSSDPASSLLGMYTNLGASAMEVLDTEAPVLDLTGVPKKISIQGQLDGSLKNREACEHNHEEEEEKATDVIPETSPYSPRPIEAMLEELSYIGGQLGSLAEKPSKEKEQTLFNLDHKDDGSFGKNLPSPFLTGNLAGQQTVTSPDNPEHGASSARKTKNKVRRKIRKGKKKKKKKEEKQKKKKNKDTEGARFEDHVPEKAERSHSHTIDDPNPLSRRMSPGNLERTSHKIRSATGGAGQGCNTNSNKGTGQAEGGRGSQAEGGSDRSHGSWMAGGRPGGSSRGGRDDDDDDDRPGRREMSIGGKEPADDYKAFKKKSTKHDKLKDDFQSSDYLTSDPTTRPPQCHVVSRGTAQHTDVSQGDTNPSVTKDNEGGDLAEQRDQEGLPDFHELLHDTQVASDGTVTNIGSNGSEATLVTHGSSGSDTSVEKIPAPDDNSVEVQELDDRNGVDLASSRGSGNGFVSYSGEEALKEFASQVERTADKTLSKSTGMKGVVLMQYKQLLSIRQPIGGYDLGREWNQVAFLGAGSSSTCFLAIDNTTKFKFVAKEISHSKFREMEVLVLCHLDHPNIVKLYGVLQAGDSVYLLMEYVEGVTLHTMIEKHPLFTATEDIAMLNKWLACYQSLLRVLSYLKDKGVIHNDIKAENILVRHGTCEVVLIDYGLAEMLRPPAVCIAGKRVGAVAHLSPEKARRESCDYGVDVWAATCTIKHCLTGTYAWADLYPDVKNRSDLLDLILRNLSPVQEVHAIGLPNEVVYLLELGWTTDWNQRPSARGLLQHVAGLGLGSTSAKVSLEEDSAEGAVGGVDLVGRDASSLHSLQAQQRDDLQNSSQPNLDIFFDDDDDDDEPDVASQSGSVPDEDDKPGSVLTGTDSAAADIGGDLVSNSSTNYHLSWLEGRKNSLEDDADPEVQKQLLAELEQIQRMKSQGLKVKFIAMSGETLAEVLRLELSGVTWRNVVKMAAGEIRARGIRCFTAVHHNSGLQLNLEEQLSVYLDRGDNTIKVVVLPVATRDDEDDASLDSRHYGYEKNWRWRYCNGEIES